MSAFTTSRLANGHSLTLVKVEKDFFGRANSNSYYKVEERNELGVFIRVAFSCALRTNAQTWINRAMARGFAS